MYQIFVRPLADGSHAVAILNTADKRLSQTADFTKLALGKYAVYDACQQRTIARKVSNGRETLRLTRRRSLS